MNWTQAQSTCQQRGLHLITIQKFNEASAIAPLVKKYQQNENIWITLEKPIQNKQWKFTHRHGNGNGKHKPSNGQEVTIKKEVCVELVAREGFLKWNNLDCEERRSFLCQTLHLHSELLMKESNVTKLSKVTESNDKNKDYKLTKYGGKIREKTTTKEDQKIKENLFTNNHSSEKSSTSLLMMTLALTSMKLLILTCLVAVALARPVSTEENLEQKRIPREDMLYQHTLPFQPSYQLDVYPYAAWFHPAQIMQHVAYSPFHDTAKLIASENSEKTDIIPEWW
uniref:Alpha-S1-casein n=1 Tax=Equus caballus TaxID=9796 RepID=A0A3Q2GSP4_HORSE